MGIRYFCFFQNLQVDGYQQVHVAFKWPWKIFCQPKHKVFFWLLLQEKFSTRNILRRRQMFLESYNCVLCQEGVEENRDHLFLNCYFARTAGVCLE